jgi:hypothetical protein
LAKYCEEMKFKWLYLTILVLLALASRSSAIKRVGDYLIDEDDVEDNNHDRLVKNKKLKCFAGEECNYQEVSTVRGCRDNRVLINRKCYKVISYKVPVKVKKTMKVSNAH